VTLFGLHGMSYIAEMSYFVCVTLFGVNKLV